METTSGEAVRRSVSDEVDRPQNEPENAGQGLLERAFARENLNWAWKRVKANKGAAGVDGLDIRRVASSAGGAARRHPGTDRGIAPARRLGGQCRAD